MIDASDIRETIKWLESLERAAKRKKQPEHAAAAQKALRVIRGLYGHWG